MDKPAIKEQLSTVVVRVIPSNIARKYTIRYHYMKTFPPSKICFGVFYKRKLCGCLTFGSTKSSITKVHRYIENIKDNEILEMQRMHISDILGHNVESFVLARVMEMVKKNTNIRVVITHAGGCKNDCGIVYQASGWLYFGSEKCNDFYLTKSGEYKNYIAAARYGRVPKGVKGAENICQVLFGDGEIVCARRYTYLYPIDKNIRRRLKKTSLDFPKDSSNFRLNQKWV